MPDGTTSPAAVAPGGMASSGMAPAIATFYRLIDQAQLPARADRVGAGTLPVRAARHCDAVTSASAFGWWVHAPLDLTLLWDGERVFWSWDGQPDWAELTAAQFPHFAARFDAAAPAAAQGGSPPFLAVLPEPGCVQIWTGLLARTAPDWSLLVRAPANLPAMGGYTLYEGIVESDRWFGPVFTNLRLTRTDVPVRIRTTHPLAQLQPLPRLAYDDATLARVGHVPALEQLSGADWDEYVRTVVAPCDDPERRPGGYAAAARRRRRGGCPMGV